MPTRRRLGAEELVDSPPRPGVGDRLQKGVDLVEVAAEAPSVVVRLGDHRGDLGGVLVADQHRHAPDLRVVPAHQPHEGVGDVPGQRPRLAPVGADDHLTGRLAEDATDVAHEAGVLVDGHRRDDPGEEQEPVVAGR